MSEKETKSYCVLVPFAGYFAVYVEAVDKEEAVSLAFDADLSIRLKTETGDAEIQGYDTFKSIIRGNVSSAPLNEYKVDCLDD